jgi:hypothetical protein
MDFKRKREEILSEGAKQRGEFSPQPGSAPLRAYNYYVSKGGYVPPTENFCHFWRVVVIWAPLYAFYFKVLVPFGNSPVGRGLGALFASPARGARKVHSTYTNHVPQHIRKKVPEYAFKGFITLILLFVLFALGLGFVDNWLVTTGVIAFFATVIGAAIGVGTLVERAAERERAERRALMERYWNNEIDYPFPRTTKAKKSGPVKRALQTVKEYLILLAQIVRVKKWKICPIVQIPEA